MPKDLPRKWLYDRSQEEWAKEDLSFEEIAWIMEEEENQTTLLKLEYDPASGGNQTPTSGGQWSINAGNMLCLAEMVWWSRLDLSMYEVYRMWLGLPILAHRRKHSESGSEQAQMVRNAKKLQHQETGFNGLNSRQRRQRRG